MRVAVAIRRGEQFAEISEFGEALKEYQEGARDQQKQLPSRNYRIAAVFFLQKQLSIGRE